MIEQHIYYVEVDRATSFWDRYAESALSFPALFYKHELIEQIYPRGENLRLRRLKRINTIATVDQTVELWDSLFCGRIYYRATTKLSLIHQGWPSGKSIEVEGIIPDETYHMVESALECTGLRKLRMSFQHIPETIWNLDLIVNGDRTGIDFVVLEGETLDHEAPAPFVLFPELQAKRVKYHSAYSNANLTSAENRAALRENPWID